MRGATPITFPVPTGGWRTDVPVFLVPPDALADGLNVTVDLNGQLQPRRGYEPLSAQLPTDPPPGRISGGISWSGTGAQILVVSTLTRWWYFDGAAWVDITGPPLDGEAAVPARFAQFAIDAVTQQDVLYGVNGSEHNLMRRWVVSDPPQPAETMVGTAGTGAGLVGFSCAASDMAVVANRLVLIDTTESGNRFPRRVRWSQTNDGTAWPALAFEDLQGDAGNLIAIQVASRTTAIIYAQAGAWIMSATQGDDAGAFVFDRLQGAYAAPVSPAAICNIGGQHYYLATDGHFWRCDGQSAYPISQAIDAGVALLLATGFDQKPSALYDQVRLRIWFFVCFADDGGEPKSAIPYYLQTGAWGVPQRFADPITTAFQVIEQMGPTWDNPGKDADGNDYTWDSAPWPSWDDIPESFAPAMYVGLGNGKICRFYTATTDNGVAIDYRAEWGRRALPDLAQRFEVNTIEAYLIPNPNAEDMEFLLQGYRTPYDTAPVTLIDTEIPQDSPDDWLIRLDPVPLTPAGSFRMANLLKLTISGSSTVAAPMLSGCVAYAFITQRPDIAANVTDNI